MNDFQISFLGENDQSTSENILKLTADLKLDVAKVSFVEGMRLNWEELFSGFNTLYAITFSSGIDFIAKALDLFDEGEIIFGCEHSFIKSISNLPPKPKKVHHRVKSEKNLKNFTEFMAITTAWYLRTYPIPRG